MCSVPCYVLSHTHTQDFSDWSQCQVLELVGTYKPSSETEVRTCVCVCGSTNQPIDTCRRTSHACVTHASHICHVCATLCTAETDYCSPQTRKTTDTQASAVILAAVIHVLERTTCLCYTASGARAHHTVYGIQNAALNCVCVSHCVSSHTGVRYPERARGQTVRS